LHFIDSAIRYLYFLSITVSISLLALPMLIRFMQGRILISRYRRLNIDDSNKPRIRLNKLRRLLGVTVGSTSDAAVLMFVFLSFSLFITTLVFMAYSGHSFVTALFISIMLGSIPQASLMVYRYFSQIKGSHE